MLNSAKISKFPAQIERPNSQYTPDPGPCPSTENPDPTRDIRRLIEDLQVAAREAQVRQQLAEEERDQLKVHINTLQTELAAAESSDLRISTLEYERDALSQQQKATGNVIAELKMKLEVTERQLVDALRRRDDASRLFKDSQRTIDEAMRAKDEALQQRGTAIRQKDSASKERDDLAAKLRDLNSMLADAQKALLEAKKGAAGGGRNTSDAIEQQITSLRQARDNAAAQAVEFKARIADLEDELAMASYDRESASKAAAKALADLQSLQKSIEEGAAEREREKAEISESRALIESLQKQCADAVAEREAQAKTIAEISGKLDDLRKRNATLKNRNITLVEGARKSADTAKELRVEVEKRAKELESIRAEIDEVSRSTEAARQRAVQRDAELEELRVLTAGKDGDHRMLDEALQAALAEARSTKEERDQALRLLEDARASASIARQQLADADSQRSLNGDQANRELDQLKAQVRDGAVLARNYEKMRLEMIDVSSKLETAQDQIRQLSASLAEARLRNRGLRSAATTLHEAPLSNRRPESSGQDINPIGTMRDCLQKLRESPGDPGRILELRAHVNAFSDTVDNSPECASRRVIAMLDALLKTSADGSQRLTDGTLSAISQAIDLIATLSVMQSAGRVVKLDPLYAYVVDDEVDSCEVIANALAVAGIDARTTASAGNAIQDLVSRRYDLILLDIWMPEISGFELFDHIREMDQQAKAAVLFLSGDPSSENLAAAARFGASGLIAKPIMVEELCLRSVTAIVKSRLSNR